MFSPKRVRRQSISSKVTILTGGLNESISNLEMKAGELSECSNYTELEGLTHGYTSVPGYERYDGQALASTVSVVIEDGVVVDDSAREAQRDLILVVPGEGKIWGVHVYKSVLYAIRNNVGQTASAMYKESGAGWVLVSTFANPITAPIDFLNFRFSLYLANIEVMIWADGANDLQSYNGTTVSTITTPTTDVPFLCGAWKNRLFIAMPAGHVYFSAVGDPSDFTTASITGEIFVGEDITSIQDTPGGALVLSTQNSINILYYESVDADFVFRMEEFSNTSGMIANTNQRMLGTVYFADDRGVTTLETAQEYGDFLANTLAKKVQKTFQTYKQFIVASATDREKNQYQLFFKAGKGTLGLIFTFSGKYLRGTTLIEYPHELSVVTTGKDSLNDDISYFGGEDGYVYKRNSGTSFDGELIETRLATAFHSYNTPTRWKDFKNILFELSADSGLEVLYRTEFDYLSSNFPSTQPIVEHTDSGGGIWGRDRWGSFLWGSAYLTQLSQKMVGYGSNMRLLITTSDKYREPHTLHNFVTEYVIGERKM